MYRCKPERIPKQVYLLLGISAAVTALLFLASTLILEYTAPLSTLGMIALMVSILLNVRYSLTEYEYAVNSTDFAITKILGNKRQIVCNVSLETATEIISKRDYDHLPQKEKAIIKYSLNQNMFAESYVLRFVFNGKPAMIEFEPNVEFVSIVHQAIQNANSSQE